jgi:NitT/TauT family transport system substrate-binding protein
MRVRRSGTVLASFVALALVAAACSGDDDDAADDASGDGEGSGEVTEVTAVLPFPSGINFYPFFVGEANGYYAEEGLSVTTEVGDGSGQALARVLDGSAEMCLCSPGPVLEAIGNEDAPVELVYTLYQSDVFALVAPDGSTIDSVESLRGQTIGVGAIDGGETAWLTSLLAAQGLEQDTDYTLLAVGEGGQAISAFEGDDIAAYASAFPDIAIMRLRDFDVNAIDLPGADNFFDALIVMNSEWVDENPELVEGIGRATAKATVWGFDHDSEVLDITGEEYPEELEDRDFALALLDETQALFELPDSAGGRWGYSVPERVDFLVDYLIDQGAAPEGVDPAVFNNDFVTAYNEFDPDDL